MRRPNFHVFMVEPSEMLPGGIGNNEPIRTTPVHEPAPSRNVKCEFCQCVLAPNGDVLKRGENATAYMKMADQLDECRDELRKSGDEVTKLRARVVELEGTRKAREVVKW
jgi:hypothetical protein